MNAENVSTEGTLAPENFTENNLDIHYSLIIVLQSTEARLKCEQEIFCFVLKRSAISTVICFCKQNNNKREFGWGGGAKGGFFIQMQ